MALPKIGDGEQVGDGNTNETLVVGASGQPVTFGTAATLTVGSGASTISIGSATATINVGTTTASKVGAYGVTPIVQRSGAAQGTALVATASSSDITTDVKAAIIEIMNTLTAIGLWKGAA